MPPQDLRRDANIQRCTGKMTQPGELAFKAFMALTALSTTSSATNEGLLMRILLGFSKCPTRGT